jgi:hypothetical protein
MSDTRSATGRSVGTSASSSAPAAGAAISCTTWVSAGGAVSARLSAGSADAAAVDSHQASAVPAAAPPTTVSVRRTMRRANAAVSRAVPIV